MKVLNSYAGLIALAALGMCIYIGFVKKDVKGESPASKFFGLGRK